MRILQEIPRTTNSIEGWHRSFNAKNEVKHPNIARLVHVMKEEEEINHFHLLRALSGIIELPQKDLKKEVRIKQW